MGRDCAEELVIFRFVVAKGRMKEVCIIVVRNIVIGVVEKG